MRLTMDVFSPLSVHKPPKPWPRIYALAVLGLAFGGIPSTAEAAKFYVTAQEGVMRANLTGTELELLVPAAAEDERPISVAVDVDGGKLYWTYETPEGGKIQRADLLDGGNVETLITDVGSPVEIEVDASDGKIYFVSRTDGIFRADLDGTGQELLVPLPRCTGLALDVPDGKMYWTNAGDDLVQRANLDGTEVEDLVAMIDLNPNVA